MSNGWKGTTESALEHRSLVSMAQGQTASAMCIFRSILIRALNEKLNVQFIMVARAAGESKVIL